MQRLAQNSGTPRDKEEECIIRDVKGNSYVNKQIGEDSATVVKKLIIQNEQDIEDSTVEHHQTQIA